MTATAPSPPPPNLDPPFRGYIETTFDALLVFEAARRGMIPRVTRRLIERERGMVQSGAVFVFDEHESGIKRWTDGLVWSPSRILGNFLVYRETDKKSHPAGSTPNKSSDSPIHDSPSGSTPLTRPATATMGIASQSFNGSPHSLHHLQPSVMDTPPNQMHAVQQAGGSEQSPLGQGALARPRSASEGGGAMDRQKERQLVGSLTNSYKFKDGGLVKKTMSVSVNGFAQHMVSYYSVEDVLAGKLRTPSTIPELASLDISAEYLHKQNFRFPPMIEIGPDGIPRYRGEPEEPTSPQSPTSNYSFHSFPTSSTSADFYDTGYSQMTSHAPRVSSPRNRSVTVPMPIPLPSPAHSMQGSTYMGPGSANSTFYESPSVASMHYAPPIARQSSSSSVHSTASGAMRPGSSSRRYEPYGPGSATSPRSSVSLHYGHAASHRRQSQPGPPEVMYPPGTGYDVKPSSYNYQPPSTAPSSFSAFYPPDPHAHTTIQSPIPASATYTPTTTQGYSTWQPVHTNAGSTSRLLPTSNRPDFANPGPPSSAGSASSNGNGVVVNGSGGVAVPGQAAPSNDQQWASHASASLPGAAPGVWEANGTNANGSHNYMQPLHQAHEGWGKTNADAIA
ncbi:hypothetical protein CI109_106751 [Kwoniella shandongensis]|uniref:Uncharacterized protein n=1 Tax=Kwoniella shandongensis TaxID=1734106 RepID=A0A5M6CAL5_9TREE|nr:uncharacterized protein CI109_000992 [Kwoniella shandongensis]KAA5530812.1 hypothetical protein CI109_000992 [Kwoniella shandongensis]